MDDQHVLERRLMVAEQIKARGVTDARLLQAFESVPRHLFIPQRQRAFAYQDMAVPIEENQTISQPYMAAVMTDQLALTGEERVLEIGTGSGYQTAILAGLAKQVYTIEYLTGLAGAARTLLDSLGVQNVVYRVGDGSSGWPEAAPFAGILVTAAAPSVPQPLLDQLAEGGRLVIPVEEQGLQVLQVWTRTGDGFVSRRLFTVAFVPLRGKYGKK